MPATRYQLHLLARAWIDGRVKIHLADPGTMLSIEGLLENGCLILIARGRGRDINRIDYAITERGKQIFKERIEIDR